MAFSNEIEQYLVSTPVRYDEFNRRQGQLLANDIDLANQVGVLSGLQNGFKIYKSLEDLGLTAGTETMLDIANAMQQNSMLNLYVAGPNNPVAYPTSRYGQLHVVKTHASRVRFDYIINTGKSAFYGFADTTGFKGWESIATTDKTDISLLNGWTVYVGQLSAIRTGNIVTVPDVRLKGGVGTKGTVIFNLPVGYRPPSTRHVKVYGSALKNTLLTVSSSGDVTIMYDDFAGTTDISYALGFSFSIT